MPTVPDLAGPQTLPDVRGTYEVQSTGVSAGIAAFGQGVANLGQSIASMQQRQAAIEAKVEAKRQEAGANAAISTAAERRLNAEIEYGQAIRSSTNREQSDKALENFNKAVEIGDSDATKGLSGDYEREQFANWSTRDSLSRKERTLTKYLDRQNFIITDSAIKQVDLSAVDYTHFPDPTTRAAFDASVDRYISAANMTPEAAKLYRTIETYKLHNEVVQTKINGNDPVAAKSYLDEHREEMDKKTWADFDTHVNKHITENEAKQAGVTIASQAESVDADGRIQVDYKKIEEDIKALPKEQQDIARARANDRIQDGVRSRDNASKQFYFNTLPLVREGKISPDSFSPAERAKFTPSDWQAIERERKVFLNAENEFALESKKQLQDSASASLSSKAMLDLDLLANDDKPEAVAILMSKLTPDVRAAMTKSDIDMLTKHAEIIAKGGDVASFDDIMAEVSRQTNKPVLRTDKNEQKTYVADNPEFLTMVQDRTRGVSRDNMPVAIRDAVRAYSFKTRYGSTVAEVMRSGDLRKIEGMELDIQKGSPQEATYISQFKLEKEIAQLDDVSRRRLITRRVLQGAGLSESYRQDATGKVIPVPTEEIFKGLEKASPPAPLQAGEARVVGLTRWY